MSPVQEFGSYATDMGDGRMATCAFGAAGIVATGIGASVDEVSDAACEAIRPLLHIRPGACPVCAWNSDDANLFSHVTHLNDDHRWTREQIADWLDEQGL